MSLNKTLRTDPMLIVAAIVAIITISFTLIGQFISVPAFSTNGVGMLIIGGSFILFFTNIGALKKLSLGRGAFPFGSLAIFVLSIFGIVGGTMLLLGREIPSLLVGAVVIVGIVIIVKTFLDITD